MRATQMQCERSPCAPPLSALHAGGIQLPDVERVQADEAIGNGVGNAEQAYGITHTSRPGIAMQWRRRRCRLRRLILGLVLVQLIERPMRIGLGDFQCKLPAVRCDRTGDAHGSEHEGAILAVAAPERAIDLDAGLDHLLECRGRSVTMRSLSGWRCAATRPPLPATQARS